MSDCAAPTESKPDPLEERIAQALPRLRAHLAGGRARVQGLELEDVAQEVVARALRYRESYDASRSLWPWLRRMADRVVSDQRAAGARLPTLVEECDPADEERAPTLDVREEVARCLGQLSARERDVLVRFHRDGQSVSTIATALGIPEGTVKSHLSRARRRLATLEPEST